jgi:GntR family transcriptional regulator
MSVLGEGAPIFSQVAERLAEDIAVGALAEGERVPSTNELAAYYRINPATAAKGINVLIDDGLLEKRRGIGMFVATGARERLLDQRRHDFAQRYIEPMLAEASRLGIDINTLLGLVREPYNGQADLGSANQPDQANHADPANHDEEGSKL